nr:uncharacterized protein LOC122172830 isoform X2 [Chrysemys picta bellii]
MVPKDRSVWWVWISVLCAGTVARAAEQGQSPKDPGQSGPVGGTASYFTWTAERTDRNATWGTTNTTTSTGGPTTPNTTVLIPVQDTPGHKTKSRSRAGSIDESSDSDSQDNQAVHSAAHVIPHPEAWNRTHAETLQAKETLTTEENEAALSDPDPSPSQIEQNTAADSAAPPS